MSGVLKSHAHTPTPGHTHNKNRKGYVCNKFSLGAPTPKRPSVGTELWEEASLEAERNGS